LGRNGYPPVSAIVSARELLSRENKRLEQELIKISRESNSKMLQEINRNIARLAPKVVSME